MKKIICLFICLLSMFFYITPVYCEYDTLNQLSTVSVADKNDKEYSENKYFKEGEEGYVSFSKSAGWEDFNDCKKIFLDIDINGENKVINKDGANIIIMLNTSDSLCKCIGKYNKDGICTICKGKGKAGEKCESEYLQSSDGSGYVKDSDKNSEYDDENYTFDSLTGKGIYLRRFELVRDTTSTLITKFTNASSGDTSSNNFMLVTFTDNTYFINDKPDIITNNKREDKHDNIHNRSIYFDAQKKDDKKNKECFDKLAFIRNKDGIVNEMLFKQQIQFGEGFSFVNALDTLEDVVKEKINKNGNSLATYVFFITSDINSKENIKLINKKSKEISSLNNNINIFCLGIDIDNNNTNKKYLSTVTNNENNVYFLGNDIYKINEIYDNIYDAVTLKAAASNIEYTDKLNNKFDLKGFETVDGSVNISSRDKITSDDGKIINDKDYFVWDMSEYGYEIKYNFFDNTLSWNVDKLNTGGIGLRLVLSTNESCLKNEKLSVGEGVLKYVNINDKKCVQKISSPAVSNTRYIVSKDELNTKLLIGDFDVLLTGEANGKTFITKKVSLNKKNNYEHIFEFLPVYDDKNNKIKYELSVKRNNVLKRAVRFLKKHIDF